jgi:transcriptional regulator with XRE-family HTH domain
LEAAQMVYEMRKKAGLTQTEISKKLHTKQPNYARIERGQNVTINMLANIASACGAEIKISYRLKHA